MNDSLSERLPASNPAQQTSAGGNRPKSHLPLGTIAGIIMISAAVGAGSGAGVATLIDNGSSSTPAATTTTAQTTAPAVTSASASPTLQSVAAVYAKARPSVVEIAGSSSRTGSGGTGSGVILDSDGHIVTNFHVVDGFDQLQVRLADGTTLAATVTGTDPGDDLAVIKIDPSTVKLTPVALGDISKLNIGDQVVAIGNPLDLEASVTEGVVSGMARILNGGAGGRPLRQLLQTDAAINPGNSGGGLFNLNGELIGITNAIENPSGANAFAGIGYAIPVSTLQHNLPQMLAGQTVAHARLGISLVDVDTNLVQQYGLTVDHGVLVGSVSPGSGAANAGLRGTTANAAGDVIVAVDSQPVKTFEDLATYIDSKNPGDKVTLSIVRGGQQTSVTVTLDTWTQ